MKKIRGILFIALKILIALSLLYWTAQKTSIDFGKILGYMDFRVIATGNLLILISIILSITRWKLLLLGQGINTPIVKLTGIYFIGNFFNIFLPGGLGGDILKTFYFIGEHSVSKASVVISIIADRLLGMFSLTFVCLLSIALNFHLIRAVPELAIMGLWILGLFFGFIVFALVASSKKFIENKFSKLVFEKIPAGNLARRAVEVIQYYRSQKKLLLYSIICSVGAQLTIISFFALVSQKINPEISTDIFFFVVPLGLMAMALPIAPVGLGTGQVTFFFLVNLLVGNESNLGPALVTIYQLTSVAWSLPGGLIYVFRKKVSGT